MKQALRDAYLNPNDIDKLILVGGTTRIPAVQDSVEKYIGKAPEKGIDPMECVAKGAAIQGAILEGEIKGLVLLDVISQSLGTESAYDINVILIKKNTKIPTKKTEEFTTVYDYQPSVTCNVLQGESIIASENVSLGEFELEGIALAPQGVPNIDVTFEVDSNGIIHATAQDQNTGVKKSITIKSPNKLTEEEIQNLK
jgi:molecular chaperone DnaK